MTSRKPPNIPERPCEQCESIYKPGNHNAKYCSPCKEDKEKVWSKTSRTRNRETRLASKRIYDKEYRTRPEVRAAHTARQQAREAKKKQAVPTWFDSDEVKYIYKLAKDRVLEVDHIVPLNSPLVCGLHVQDNLRCIPAALNKHKSNKYWPDMP